MIKKENFTKNHNPEKYPALSSCYYGCSSGGGSSDYRDHPYTYVHRDFSSNKNKYFRPSVYSELEGKLTKGFGLAFGCELYQEKIVLENGWKWSEGRLEKENRYNLADLIVIKPHISLKFYEGSGSYSIDVGSTSLRGKRLTELGKKTDIKFRKNGWFVAFRIGGVYNQNDSY